MYVYKSNEKRKFQIFLDFFIFWFSLYSKHVLKHFDTLLHLNRMKKWKNISQKKSEIFFFSFDLNAIVYQNALKHVLNIN